MKSKLTLYEAHCILGHVSQPVIKHMVEKGLVKGLDVDTKIPQEFCEVCVRAKVTYQSFPEEMKNRATKYGDLVYTDLWRPVQTTSIGGSVYYISFMDDYSHEMKVRFLKAKSEALTAFQQYEANLIWQHPHVHIHKV